MAHDLVHLEDDYYDDLLVQATVETNLWDIRHLRVMNGCIGKR